MLLLRTVNQLANIHLCLGELETALPLFEEDVRSSRRLLGATPEELTAYDQRKARQDPAQSSAADSNAAQVARVPNNALVYLLKKAPMSRCRHQHGR